MRYTIDDTNIQSVWNDLDETGRLLNLPRLLGENNASYRNRLEQVFARPANATNTGLLNALVREFNYTPNSALTITCSLVEEGACPRVVLRNQSLYLYTDSDTLVASWFLRDEPVATLELLVNTVNGVDYFNAELDDNIDSDLFSSYLLETDSYTWVLQELIPGARSFSLANSPLVLNSVSFSEVNIFTRETATLTKAGDYTLDYSTGEVKCLLYPSGYGNVSYQHYTNGITLFHTPFAISDLNDNDIKNWLFYTVERDTWDDLSERYVSSFPHSLTYGIINELKNNSKSLWGK